MAIPGAPFQSPANVFGQFRSLGQAVGGAIKDVGMTVEQYAAFKKTKNYVTASLADAKATFGLSDKQMARIKPDITPDEVEEIITSYKAIEEKTKELKNRLGDAYTPSAPGTHWGVNRKGADDVIAQMENSAKGAEKKSGIKRSKKQSEFFGTGDDTTTAFKKSIQLGEVGEDVEKLAMFQSKQEAAKAAAGRKLTDREIRVSKEMSLRQNQVLQNSKTLAQTDPKSAEEQLKIFEGIQILKDKGVTPDDEKQIDNMAIEAWDEAQKDQKKSTKNSLAAKVIQARIREDRQFKKFGNLVKKSILEREIKGKFKDLDEFFEAMGQPNPFPPETEEGKEPTITERGKAILDKIFGFFGGGEEPTPIKPPETTQPESRFKTTVVK